MKTILQIEITHSKPLPDKTPITDIVSQRAYSYLYSQGCEAGVKATLLNIVQTDKGQEVDK
jgi:hypothetical protein